MDDVMQMQNQTYVEKIMYKATLEKIKELCPEKLFVEYAVSLPNGRKGSYDFLIEHNGTRIGFELMSRPTKGKLKEKLAYLHNVDKYIFVFPMASFELYKRQQINCFTALTRPKFFPEDFSNKKLYVWLCSIDEKRIVTQARFEKIFNVKK